MTGKSDSILRICSSIAGMSVWSNSISNSRGVATACSVAESARTLEVPPTVAHDLDCQPLLHGLETAPTFKLSVESFQVTSKSRQFFGGTETRGVLCTEPTGGAVVSRPQFVPNAVEKAWRFADRLAGRGSIRCSPRR
jgi:hypothetical protein